MQTEQVELHAAVSGREHWTVEGATAVYSPPPGTVRVTVTAGPAGKERPFYAYVDGDGLGKNNTGGFPTAADAVRWAEEAHTNWPNITASPADGRY